MEITRTVAINDVIFAVVCAAVIFFFIGAFTGNVLTERTFRRLNTSQADVNAWIAKCRPAVRADYQLWMNGYIRNGGKLSGNCDYNWSMAGYWFVAKDDFEIEPLYGVAAINIIVPKNVTVIGRPGHSVIYRMVGYTCSDADVYSYKDIKYYEEKGE